MPSAGRYTDGWTKTDTQMEKYKIMEALNRIYENTNGRTCGGMRKYGRVASHVATILSRRGVLVRTGNRGSTKYTWNTQAPAPTKVLCDNVTKDYCDMLKAENARRQGRRRRKPETQPDLQPVPKPEPPTTPVPTWKQLAEFSDKDLISELFFRRGYLWIVTDGNSTEVMFKRTTEGTMAM